MKNEYTILIFELTGYLPMPDLQTFKPGNNIQRLIKDMKLHFIYLCMGIEIGDLGPGRSS